MSQPPKCSVTKPTPASHSRRASSICWPRPARAVEVAGARLFAGDVERLRGPGSGCRSNAWVSKLSRPGIRPVRSTSRLSVSNASEQAAAIARGGRGVTCEVHVVAGVAGGVERGDRPSRARPGRRRGCRRGGRRSAGRCGGLLAPRWRARMEPRPGLIGRHAVVGGRIVVAGHDPVGAAAVAGVAVREGADEGHLVGDARPCAGRCRPARCRGRWSDGAGDRAELGRGGHLGIEGFDVGRAAAQPEPDDRGLARGGAGTGGRSRARSSPGRERPPRPKVPTRRKSRREDVPQRAPSWDANMVSMAGGLLEVVRLWGSESGG